MATPFDALFAHYGGFFELPAGLLEAVARTESNLNPAAIGDGGRSRGLFQIYDTTARQLGFTGELDELLDPEVSTAVAARYMRAILDSQGEWVPENFYSEYNSGIPDLWQRSSEVRRHVENFMRNYRSTAVTAAAGGSLVLLAAIAAVWFWRRRRNAS